MTMVVAWSAEVSAVEIGDDIRVSLADGTTHVHRRYDAGWHVELLAGTAHSSIDLGGIARHESVITEPADEDSAIAPIVLHRNRATEMSLGERQYRRSELSWLDARRPTARVVLEPAERSFRISVHVAESDLNFVMADAVNPYDNEHPDINGDGVQLYVRTDAGSSGWSLVP
ncbi:MAG: hypothetical protein ACREJT_15560, partial [Myxococcota bacterium]